MKRLFILGTIVILLAASAAFAVFSTGDTFGLRRLNPASGGTEADSPSYRLESLGGQTAIGTTTSASYGFDHGFYSPAWLASAAVSNDKTVPAVFRLGSTYPNPFNPTTNIQYDLPRPCRTVLSVFDVKGRLVKTLVDEDRDAGRHQVVWNGQDRGGMRAASGLYFVKMRAGDFRTTRKITLLK